MRNPSIWACVLGVEKTVVERVAVEEDGSLVAKARPRRSERQHCGLCRRRCPRYDWGDGRRRWRCLDLGYVVTYLEAEAPRVRCREHGVVVAAVPWARHGSSFTRAFEEQAAWLATHCSKSAVAGLMRVVWRSVGRIITRVVHEQRKSQDLLDGLRRIGIDEISYRKGQRYLMVVVNHDTGRLVWAANGRDSATVRRFFTELGQERCAKIEKVSCDGAEWIMTVVEEECPNATICLDPFHVVQWATKALDEVRREVWNAARIAGLTHDAKALKGARWALWHNPGNITSRQRTTLAIIQKTNKPLYRAYLLKEQLRLVFQLPFDEAVRALDRWLSWARRCRLQPFVKLARSVTYYRADIEAALQNRLSNALVESTNTKIRLITRRSFGFHSPAPLIALAMLSLGGLCPPLPGRG